MSALILHAYDASPFTQRVLRMFGLKRLEWQWVDTPLLPPKADLTAMTGGYRGTPVLQIGRELYVDSQRIALELERRHPSPAMLHAPAGRAWLPWSDNLFRAVLGIVLAQQAHTWPSAFQSDRRALFPHIDFDAAPADCAHHELQLGAGLALLEAQLGTNAFIDGAQPGLADVNLQPFIAIARGCAPALLQDFARVLDWETRVAALGEGQRQRVEVATAHQAACAAGRLQPATGAWHGPIGQGAQVLVTPVDNRRGAMHGRLVASGHDEVAIEHEWAGAGTMRVHLPRSGYRVDPERD